MGRRFGIAPFVHAKPGYLAAQAKVERSGSHRGPYKFRHGTRRGIAERAQVIVVAREQA
jgi:hypothetical protein